MYNFRPIHWAEKKGTFANVTGHRRNPSPQPDSAEVSVIPVLSVSCFNMLAHHQWWGISIENARWQETYM